MPADPARLGFLFAEILHARDLDRFADLVAADGTHARPLLGCPPTGSRFATQSIDIWRLPDGPFVEHRDELNLHEVFARPGAPERVS